MGNFELERIATFASGNWPANTTSVSCLRLANSGFRYTGVSDQVTCPLCGLVVEDWRQKIVNPLYEHRRRSPHCPFFSSSSLEGRQTSGVADCSSDLSSSLHHVSSSTEQTREVKTFLLLHFRRFNILISCIFVFGFLHFLYYIILLYIFILYFSVLFFTARCYASAVLAMGLCLSVRLCPCLSVTSLSSTKTAKQRITQTTPHHSPGRGL